jgi:hypothetical protein
VLKLERSEKKMNSRLFWIAIVFVCLCGSAHAGVLEICKVSDPLFSLSGLYSFTIAGQPGTVVAPADVCTAPFLLPDGNAVITEVPNPNSVFESVNTFPGDQLIGVDPLTASATVLIAPGNLSDPSTWLEVNFVNAPVPEPGTGWVVGLGLTVWALRNARSSVVRRRWRWQRSGAGDA